jgi:hypothetical protein
MGTCNSFLFRHHVHNGSGTDVDGDSAPRPRPRPPPLRPAPPLSLPESSHPSDPSDVSDASDASDPSVAVVDPKMVGGYAGQFETTSALPPSSRPFGNRLSAQGVPEGPLTPKKTRRTKKILLEWQDQMSKALKTLAANGERMDALEASLQEQRTLCAKALELLSAKCQVTSQATQVLRQRFDAARKEVCIAQIPNMVATRTGGGGGGRGRGNEDLEATACRELIKKEIEALLAAGQGIPFFPDSVESAVYANCAHLVLSTLSALAAGRLSRTG